MVAVVNDVLGVKPALVNVLPDGDVQEGSGAVGIVAGLGSPVPADAAPFEVGRRSSDKILMPDLTFCACVHPASTVHTL